MSNTKCIEEETYKEPIFKGSQNQIFSDEEPLTNEGNLVMRSINNYLSKRPTTARIRDTKFTVPTHRTYQRVTSAKSRFDKKHITTYHLQNEKPDAVQHRVNSRTAKRPGTA